MKFYRVEPEDCKALPNGDIIRPFRLTKCDGVIDDKGKRNNYCECLSKHIELNLNKLQSDENAELERFCQILTEKTGKTIVKDDLMEIIKTREIVIEE